MLKHTQSNTDVPSVRRMQLYSLQAAHGLLTKNLQKKNDCAAQYKLLFLNHQLLNKWQHGTKWTREK